MKLDWLDRGIAAAELACGALVIAFGVVVPFHGFEAALRSAVCSAVAALVASALAPGAAWVFKYVPVESIVTTPNGLGSGVTVNGLAFQRVELRSMVGAAASATFGAAVWIDGGRPLTQGTFSIGTSLAASPLSAAILIGGVAALLHRAVAKRGLASGGSYRMFATTRLAKRGLVPRKPKDFGRFLEWCAAPGRSWLRRVGPGYEFRHDDLRRYVDDAYPKPATRVS